MWARAVSLVGQVVWRRDLKSPHALIATLLADDEVRRRRDTDAPWRLRRSGPLFATSSAAKTTNRDAHSPWPSGGQLWALWVGWVGVICVTPETSCHWSDSTATHFPTPVAPQSIPTSH